MMTDFGATRGKLPVGPLHDRGLIRSVGRRHMLTVLEPPWRRSSPTGPGTGVEFRRREAAT
jgi:hypothetical protein